MQLSLVRDFSADEQSVVSGPRLLLALASRGRIAAATLGRLVQLRKK